MLLCFVPSMKTRHQALCLILSIIHFNIHKVVRRHQHEPLCSGSLVYFSFFVSLSLSPHQLDCPKLFSCFSSKLFFLFFNLVDIFPPPLTLSSVGMCPKRRLAWNKVNTPKRAKRDRKFPFCRITHHSISYERLSACSGELVVVVVGFWLAPKYLCWQIRECSGNRVWLSVKWTSKASVWRRCLRLRWVLFFFFV